MSAQEYELNSKNQPKLSVEEAAADYATSNEHLASWFQLNDAFLAGHTHATKDANLVPLDKVIGVLERIQSDADFASHLYLSQAITQIKNLTK